MQIYKLAEQGKLDRLCLRQLMSLTNQIKHVNQFYPNLDDIERHLATVTPGGCCTEDALFFRLPDVQFRVFGVISHVNSCPDCPLSDKAPVFERVDREKIDCLAHHHKYWHCFYSLRICWFYWKTENPSCRHTVSNRPENLSQKRGNYLSAFAGFVERSSGSHNQLSSILCKRLLNLLNARSGSLIKSIF
jgi:hypothetical protein